MPREWRANVPQEIAVEQLQRFIEPEPTDLRWDAMWPAGRRRSAQIQPWHFEVAPLFARLGSAAMSDSCPLLEVNRTRYAQVELFAC